jgi:exopolysaccharide production protein ExoQ
MKQSTSWQDRARSILPATALILPPLTVLAPLGAAPLLALAAVVLLALDWRRCRSGFSTFAGLAALLAALAIWAGTSALWSILPRHSFLEGIRFLAISASGLIIMSGASMAGADERSSIGRTLRIGILLALLVLLVERFANAPLTRLWLGISSDQYLALARFDRGITVLVLTLWPAIFTVEHRWWRGILVIAIMASAVIMSSATALLAGLLGIGIYAAARFAPRFVAGAMIAGMLVLAAAIPLATPSYDTVVTLHQNDPWIKPSGIHRLLIWRFGADRVAERPLLGWGMDASREIPGGKTDFNTMLPALHYGDRIEAMPLHPHDAALQWQLELGLPGSVLGLGIVIWTLWQIGWQARLAPDRRAGALALASAALAVGMLSFGIWQSWWLSTLWLTAALFTATGTDEQNP